jgi:DNA-binding transcriptional LysR family regulator
MRIFVAVVDAGSLAGAARRLGLSPPAVTRAILRLESRLGARLLHRTTRRLRVTESGGRFVEDCRRILAALAEAEASAGGSHAEPRGALAVTASVMFGRRHVAPIVLDLIDRHPALTVRLHLFDRVVDLLEEGVDVAVRIAPLPSSGLTAVRVGALRRVVCASPAYLREHGAPQAPGDLRHHRAIVFAPGLGPVEWAFRNGAERTLVAPPARLLVNSSEVTIAAALEGRGLVQVLSYMVAEEVRDGRLALVLEQHELPGIPVHLVHAEGRGASARVRAFVDFAAPRLRAALAEL